MTLDLDAICVLSILALLVLFWIGKLQQKVNFYDKLKPRLDKIDELDRQLKRDQERIDQERSEIEGLAKEKSKGFPWLAEAYADYYHLRDLRMASWLESKSHPAKKAAEVVKEISEARRRAEKNYRVYKYQVEYYEKLFPWLVEFKEDDIDDLIQQPSEGNYVGTQYAQNDDPARRWLTDSEYKNLPTSKKYQLALDRYWRRRKSRWEIGRDYERYVGYLYEEQGWEVSYQGIVEGFSDLGRDLICVRGDDVQIVQCKYWSQEKIIHEKHIFQLYGTSIAYKIDFPNKNVKSAFVTSTNLSERAKLFARALNIDFREKKAIETYPSIKCNISVKNNEKIYHLPFDQQYDMTIIQIEKGERYVKTVEEAEKLGFRRAYKWKGN